MITPSSAASASGAPPRAPRLALALLAASFLLPAVATGDPGRAPGDGEPTLRVMSFNLRYGTADDGDHAWPHRRPHVLATIAEFGPDLLGTQECLDFQRDDLLAGLPGYAVVAAGRDDGAEAGEMCAAFYRTDRLVLRECGTFWLSETPAEVASRGWDAALPRTATWLRLHHLASGREVLWLNAHLDHRGARARRESAALLHRWLAEHARGAVIVVTGDFNAAAATDPDSVQGILRTGRPEPGGGAPSDPLLVDTWTVRHGDDPTAGTFQGFGDRVRPGRIDWVMASPEVPVREAAIDGRRRSGLWPSDHLPVTAVLGLGSPGKAGSSATE